jgi:hypothetical protein
LIILSLLLETDPEHRFSHLELSTAAGLLTLHPEGDGTLHGNAVLPDGIEHVRGLPWDAEAVVLVEASSVAPATARLRPRGAVPCVRIGLDLSVQAGVLESNELGPAHDGLPVLEAWMSWPLEVD